MPFLRATADTVLPGSMHSLTMRIFSAGVQRLLGAALMISTVASSEELVLAIALALILIWRVFGRNGGYSRRFPMESPLASHGIRKRMHSNIIHLIIFFHNKTSLYLKWELSLLIGVTLISLEEYGGMTAISDTSNLVKRFLANNPAVPYL